MTVRMSICYEQAVDLIFDEDYFIKKHIPLVRASFEPHGLKEIEVSFPLDRNNTAAPYQAITELYFDNVETLNACLRIAGREVMMDVANYSNKQPMSFVSKLCELT